MLGLALAESLKDFAVGFVAFCFVAGVLLYLEMRSERKHKAQLEARNQADFEAHIRQTTDWEFPPRWRPPAEEYVAKPRERVK